MLRVGVEGTNYIFLLNSPSPSEMISLRSSAFICIVTEQCQKPQEIIKKQFIFKVSSLIYTYF